MPVGRFSRVCTILLLLYQSLTSKYPSLATETEYVRDRLAQYGNDLLSLGVDGMRLDAAKRNFIIFSIVSLA
jgi:hypothetical protein